MVSFGKPRKVIVSDGQFWGAGEGASVLGRVMVSDGQFWKAAKGDGQ